MKIKSFFLALASIVLLSACAGGNLDDVDTTPYTLGNDDAPVTVVEFADLQCPGCAQTSPLVEEIVRNHPDKIRLEFWHYPLTQIHNYAQMAAEAAECAGDQDKFWEYVEMAFENQRNFSDDYFKEAAAELELNQETFDQCLDDRQKRDKVMAHAREARLRGAPGTPTLFVNGQFIEFPGPTLFEEYLLELAN